jgi:hypothetical protein
MVTPWVPKRIASVLKVSATELATSGSIDPYEMEWTSGGFGVDATASIQDSKGVFWFDSYQ